MDYYLGLFEKWGIDNKAQEPAFGRVAPEGTLDVGCGNYIDRTNSIPSVMVIKNTAHRTDAYFTSFYH
jgi:hypothetical protein